MKVTNEKLKLSAPSLPTYSTFKENSCEMYGSFVNLTKPEKTPPWWKFWKKRRYVLAILASIGFLNVVAIRANMSVAAAAMTKSRTVITENGTEVYEQEFRWNSSQIGILLSSFFWGSITTQIIGGVLSEKYGGKKFFGLGILGAALLTIITPVVAKQSFAGLIAIRVLEGVFEGASFPAMLSILSRWAPPSERSQLVSISVSGCFIGTVIALTLSGVIGELWGWESIFYAFGGFALLWWLAWWLIIAETPSEDKYISKAELDYILEHIHNRDDEGRNTKHPWRSILLSGPFWATAISSFCQHWGKNTLLTQLPFFMQDIFHCDLKSSGILSALPYLALSIFAIISGFLADMLIKNEWLSITKVRKLFTCGSFLIQTVFMIGAALLMSIVGSTVCFTFAIGVGGLAMAGYGVNILDLGPSHASVMSGITVSLATLTGMISPTLTGYMVKDRTIEEWQNVFYLSAFIYMIGFITFGIFASGKLQPWAIDFKLNQEKLIRKSKRNYLTPYEDMIKTI